MNWQKVISESENLKSKSSQIHGIERIEPKRMSNQKVIKFAGVPVLSDRFSKKLRVHCRGRGLGPR